MCISKYADMFLMYYTSDNKEGLMLLKQINPLYYLMCWAEIITVGAK